MKRAFQDFHSATPRRDLPVHGLARARRELQERLFEAYTGLLETQVKDLSYWAAQPARVAAAYEGALDAARAVECHEEDVAAFCDTLGRAQGLAYAISGPGGIFLSALVNRAPEPHLTLRLRGHRRMLSFLGYRLAEGKTLVLEGDAGDFTGGELAGGRLVVTGATGDGCGTGMMGGEIEVRGHAGERTGERMTGGSLHVGGQIRGLRGTAQGGNIYRGGRLIHCTFPSIPLLEELVSKAGPARAGP